MDISKPSSLGMQNVATAWILEYEHGAKIVYIEPPPPSLRPH